MTNGPRDLAAFIGQWALQRQIDDRLAGAQGHLDGTAEIGDGLYVETGTLQFPGQPALQASRRYRWTAAAGGIEIAFDDGRPFHTLHLRGSNPTAHHDCPPDQYDVAYDFTQWPRWTSTWQVRGPRKDYTMTSAYTPLTLAAGQGLVQNP